MHAGSRDHQGAGTLSVEQEGKSVKKMATVAAATLDG